MTMNMRMRNKRQLCTLSVTKDKSRKGFAYIPPRRVGGCNRDKSAKMKNQAKLLHRKNKKSKTHLIQVKKRVDSNKQ